MAAYRCSGCGHDWPNHYSYRTCPTCGNQTWLGNGISPMPTLQADRLKAHAEFDRYYEAEDAEAVAKRERKYADENAERMERFDAKVDVVERFNRIIRGADADH